MLVGELTVLLRLPEHVLTNYCYTMLSNIWEIHDKKPLLNHHFFVYLCDLDPSYEWNFIKGVQQAVKYIFFIIRTYILSQIYILIIQYIQNLFFVIRT